MELERRRVEAELALTAGEIDWRRSYLDDGHRSLQAYLRGTCSYSDAETARVRRLSAAADGLPGLADALRDGRIGTPQANELAVAHTNTRIRERLAVFAPMLLELAERPSFREFRTCMQRFVMLADLDGAHRDLDESVANRRARVVNLNGSLHLDGGGGDPLAGHIRRVVLGADNLPINLGRKARVFTGPAREAAKLLAVQCDHLGCNLPAEVCEVDHATEWHEGGRTDRDNAGVECSGHNRDKHRKRWRTRRDTDGRMHTIRADGTIMLPVGTRPPTFPAEPATSRLLDGWADRSSDDTEQRCRTLRRTAILHAATADRRDPDADLAHLS